MSNPVFHFEIPVNDMDRAVRFYTNVFGYELSRQTVDGYEMAFFPRDADGPGASGALAKGDVYVPSKTGPIIYFDVPDIDQVFAAGASAGRQGALSQEVHWRGWLRRRDRRQRGQPDRAQCGFGLSLRVIL